MILWLSLIASPATAGALEVDALAAAVLRGLPSEATEAAALAAMPLTDDQIVELLRAGIDPVLLGRIGAPPSADEILRAEAAGPWDPAARRAEVEAGRAPPAPREYRFLTENAWVQLIDIPVILTLDSGIVPGTVLDVGVSGLTFKPDVGPREILATTAVLAVRRTDNKPIATSTVRDTDADEAPDDREPSDRATRMRRTGTGLVVAGLSTAALSGLCLLGATSQLHAETQAAEAGDMDLTLERANGAVLWTQLAYVSGGVATPMLVGGVVLLSLSHRW